MNSELISKRLEEVFSFDRLDTKLKGLLNLHKECIKDMYNSSSFNTDPIESFKNLNYKWIYAEKLLTKKYPKQDIPMNMFIHLTKILLFKDEKMGETLRNNLMVILSWDNIKDGENHDIFKLLKKILELKS
jgi:hypothetical protein|nr:MAG TPA: hypothetical protein [Caudoviricetes sp.]